MLSLFNTLLHEALQLSKSIYMIHNILRHNSAQSNEAPESNSIMQQLKYSW